MGGAKSCKVNHPATYELLKGMLPKDHTGAFPKLKLSTKVNTPPCFSSVLPMRTW